MIAKAKPAPDKAQEQTEEVRAFKLITGECVVGVVLETPRKNIIMGHDTRTFRLIKIKKSKQCPSGYQYGFGFYLPVFNTYPIPIHENNIIQEIPQEDMGLMRAFCEATGRVLIGPAKEGETEGKEGSK